MIAYEHSRPRHSIIRHCLCIAMYLNEIPHIFTQLELGVTSNYKESFPDDVIQSFENCFKLGFVTLIKLPPCLLASMTGVHHSFGFYF